MTVATPIDLSQLPFPGVVETLDYETIYARRKARLLSLVPADQVADYTAALEMDSEPMAMLLQENSYEEITWRQRVNDAARANFLAFAMDGDLDNLVALLGVQRLVVTPADPDNNVAEVKEGNTDLRKRAQLAPLGFSVAGPADAYKSHAMGADGAVLDIAVKSPEDGRVLVTVLSREGDGTASQALLDKVAATLSAATVRPLTDHVLLQSAGIVPFAIRATLFMLPGPDRSLVVAEALRRVQAYAEECRQIGREVAVSGIMAALHITGVERVQLAEPLADIATTDVQAPYCTAIELGEG
jgi:phage-related baseplate assembly protein